MKDLPTCSALTTSAEEEASNGAFRKYSALLSEPCDWIINPNRRLKYPGLAEQELILACL
jgi:hypothetical protein